MINFDKSKIWFLKCDNSLSTLLTYLILSKIKNIWFAKYQVYNGVSKVLLVDKEIIICWKYLKIF